MQILVRSRFLAATLASLTMSLFAASALAAEPSVPKAEFLNSPEAEKRDLPFSEAVRAGDLLFLAGQLGVDRATGNVVPGGIKPEARQALRLMQGILERNGYSLADVVKCTVFLADIAEWPAFNEVYREFFKKPFPARSAFAASGLARGARVEVECIAYTPARPRARNL
jgi:2-iminobutanoate/2-iminopropanoate deaminase